MNVCNSLQHVSYDFKDPQSCQVSFLAFLMSLHFNSIFYNSLLIFLFYSTGHILQKSQLFRKWAADIFLKLPILKQFWPWFPKAHPSCGLALQIPASNSGFPRPPVLLTNWLWTGSAYNPLFRFNNVLEWLTDLRKILMLPECLLHNKGLGNWTATGGDRCRVILDSKCWSFCPMKLGCPTLPACDVVTNPETPQNL